MDERETQDYVAARYLRRYSGNGAAFHRYLVDDMMADAKGHILDVGCGIGFVSSCYPTLNIEGVDFSHEMIRLNPSRCQLGDAENLPYPRRHFDTVICRGVLHHLDHPSKGVAEIRRVLKPRGQAVFLEPNKNMVTAIPRWLFRYTPWFSRQHKNFTSSELTSMVASDFTITYTGYRGYVAYPLIGFPDFYKLPVSKGAAKWLIKLDQKLSMSPVKPLGFMTLIKARRK